MLVWQRSTRNFPLSSPSEEVWPHKHRYQQGRAQRQDQVEVNWSRTQSLEQEGGITAAVKELSLHHFLVRQIWTPFLHPWMSTNLDCSTAKKMSTTSGIWWGMEASDFHPKNKIKSAVQQQLAAPEWKEKHLENVERRAQSSWLHVAASEKKKKLL